MNMKIKELIEALSRFNGDTYLYFKYKNEEITTLDGTDDLELRVKCLVSRVIPSGHEEPTCLIEINAFDD